MHWLNQQEQFREWGRRVFLGLAFVLVGGLSFEAGWLQKSLGETEPLTIQTPQVIPTPALPARQNTEAVGESSEAVPKTNSAASDNANTCTYVGSRKSNKYHLPTSRCAKQIKTENRLCFSSVEAASARGYVAGCLE